MGIYGIDNLKPIETINKPLCLSMPVRTDWDETVGSPDWEWVDIPVTDSAARKLTDFELHRLYDILHDTVFISGMAYDLVERELDRREQAAKVQAVPEV